MFSVLLNISSDYTIISTQEQTIHIPRGGLELELPKALYDIIENGEFVIENCIYVINGPGSFTNLRIGCLCLNMLDGLIQAKNVKNVEGVKKNNFRLYTISKVDLYKKLYESNIIGSRGLIYIGQQKNAWLVDFEKESCDKVATGLALTEFDTSTVDWLDDVSNRNAQPSIQCTMSKDTMIGIEHKGMKIAIDPKELGFKKEDVLVPNYMMEPNISNSKANSTISN